RDATVRLRCRLCVRRIRPARRKSQKWLFYGCSRSFLLGLDFEDLFVGQNKQIVRRARTVRRACGYSLLFHSLLQKQKCPDFFGAIEYRKVFNPQKSRTILSYTLPLAVRKPTLSDATDFDD